jgi:group I intron endonuclease
MTDTGFIYCITNKITGLQYIGQTRVSVSERYKQHIDEAFKTNRNLHLYNSMRKYGIENFTVTTLESDIPVSELNNKEIAYIKLYDTFNNGYNNTEGGGGVVGYKHSEKTRFKIGESVKASMYKINTPERTAKIIKAQKGRKFTEEHKQHLRESCKGKRYGENNPFYNKEHKQSTKDTIGYCNAKFSICQYDLKTGDVINTFKTLNEAASYIKDSNITNAKLKSIKYRITYTCENKQSHAYNFGWKYIDKV